MSTTSERILEAARALYREGGEAAISMRRIAVRVGVTATAIYRHYENKDAILVEVRGEGLERLRRHLDRAREGRNAAERLERAGWACLDFALERPEDYRALFMEPRREETDDAANEVRSALFDFLLESVKECMDAGIVKGDVSREVTLTLWAQMHGLIALYLSGAIEDDPERFRKRYARSLGRLFTGIG